jgi:hypothetical protein
MTKFLTIRHWQLFGLLCGLPIFFQFITLGSIIMSNKTNIMFLVFPIMIIILVGIFFGWLYSIGVNLHKKTPQTESLNLARFKLFLFIPMVYILLLMFFILGKFYGFSSSFLPLNFPVFSLILPLHLFSMFCIFYCFYFNAKALKTVEWHKSVTFSNFAGEFFYCGFFQ